jgi:CBS domain-containing protein
MQARQIMTSPVITVHPGTTVRDAAAALLEYRITATPVVDDHDELAGIVSEGDLVVDQFGRRRDRQLAAQRVGPQVRLRLRRHARGAAGGAARVHGRRLRPPDHAVPGAAHPLVEELDCIRTEATRTAERCLGKWTEKCPDVDVHIEVAEGPAAHELVEASRTAGLLVVGTRRHGRLAGMLLGSVSHAVLRHANCPIVIAR